MSEEVLKIVRSLERQEDLYKNSPLDIYISPAVCRTIIECLKLHVPMKPLKAESVEDKYDDNYVCTNCGNEMMTYGQKYCENCGQEACWDD
jgi:hypothetical protein